MMRELSTWRSPHTFLSSFRRDMDELFNRFFDGWEQQGISESPGSAGYFPQIESYIDGSTLFIKADLPGVDPEDVEISVENNRLTMKGERKAQHEVKNGDYVHQEVRYGSFVRTFMLPEGVNADEVNARYHKGVLEISMPLPASMEAKKVRIEIPAEARKQIAA